MTIGEAIRLLTEWAEQCRYEAIRKAAVLAVAALRAQQEPNTPLTLEELREMDGEPVWVERPGCGKRWALVQVWAKSTNVIYFTYNNGSTSLVQVELDCGGKAYRRKLEEGT